MDGSEKNRVGGDERRRAVKLQHRDALHVVLAGLPQTDVVIERQHLEGGQHRSYVNIVHLFSTSCTQLSFVGYLLRRNQPQQRPVQVDLLLEVLGGEERPFTGRASRLQR